MTPQNRQNEQFFLTENFDFLGQLSTFQAENTPKSRPSKVKTTPKHFLNNSQTTS